jgi:hypothetical protein
MSDVLPNNESTGDRIKRDIKSGLGGLVKLWGWLPLSVKYAALGAVTLFAQKKGLLPEGTTMQDALTTIGGVAALHQIEKHGQAAPKP